MKPIHLTLAVLILWATFPVASFAAGTPIDVDPLMNSGVGHPNNPFTVNYSFAYPRGGFEPISMSSIFYAASNPMIIAMRYMDSGNIYAGLNTLAIMNCPTSKTISGSSVLVSPWFSPISLTFNGNTLDFANNAYSLGTNSGTCSFTGVAICGSINLGPGSQISWSSNTLTSSSGGSISLYSSGPCATTPPTVTFSPDSYSISSGASTNLHWTATNATSCTASGAWSGAKAVSGTESTGILSASQVYFLTCTGPGGTSPLYTVPLTVIPVVPTVDLKVNGSDGSVTLAQGATKTLSWTATNATSCTASGADAFAGNKAVPTGSEVLSVTRTSTDTLSCTGPGGTTSDSVQVNATCTPSTGAWGSCDCDTETKTRTNINASCLPWTESDACTIDEKNACRDFNWKEVAP
jgi:hypothetical protein